MQWETVSSIYYHHCKCACAFNVLSLQLRDQSDVVCIDVCVLPSCANTFHVVRFNFIASFENSRFSVTRAVVCYILHSFSDFQSHRYLINLDQRHSIRFICNNCVYKLLHLSAKQIIFFLGGVAVACQLVTTRLQVRLRVGALPGHNLRQVVHTRLCSPSSIIWYRIKGSDAPRLGR